jgi:RNA polymerase sigma factor (sigma-70 family)
MMIKPSFTENVLELLPRLRAYAWALSHNRSDADDLVQETLTRALRYHDKFTEGTHLRSWLFTIMRNTHFTAVKKYTREQPGSADCVSSSVLVEPEHDKSLAQKELWAAINRLPDQYREMLVLVLVVGESYEDAARLCNCALGTVKSRVNRARRLVIMDLAGKAEPLADGAEPRNAFSSA